MSDLSDVLEGVYGKYPRLRDYGFEARLRPEGPRPHQRGSGHIEFFPPDEYYNPMPGVPYIEVYNEDLRGDALERAVFGDALHYLPAVDPRFRDLKNQFVGTITPEQSRVDRRAYDYYVKNHEETRSYQDWFDTSRSDAYLRGYLAPDERNEWAGSYTDKQKFILEAIKAHLQGQ